MTAPTIPVNGVTGGPSTSATAWSCVLPTVQDFDIVLYFVTNLGGQSYSYSGPNISEYVPSGGSAAYANGVNTFETILAGEIVMATDSGATRTITWGAAQTGKVTAVVVRAGYTSTGDWRDALDAVVRTQKANGTTTTTITPAAATPAHDDCLVLVHNAARDFAANDTALAFGVSTGYTEVPGSDATTTGGAQTNGGHAVEYKAMSGQNGVAQTPSAITTATAVGRWNSTTVVLRPKLPSAVISLAGGGGGAVTGKKGGKGSFGLAGGGAYAAAGSSAGAGTVRFSESFDGPAFGATLDQSNTNYDNGQTVTGTGTVVADAGAAVAIHGGSAKFTAPAGSTITLSRTMTGWTSGENTMRRYLQRSNKPVGAAVTWFRLRDGGTTIAQIQETVAGLLRIAQVGGAVVDTAATVMTDALSVRLEWTIDRTAGTQTLRIWYNANLNQVAPDETLTGAFTDSGTTLEMREGIGTALTTAMTMRMDEAVDKATHPIGPYSGEAHSGSFALQGGGSQTFVTKKGGKGTFGLAGGAQTSFVAGTGHQGNGYVEWTETTTGTGHRNANGTFALQGGGDFTAAGVSYITARFGSFSTPDEGGDFDTDDSRSKGGKGSFGLQGGGGGAATGKRGAKGTFGLAGGGRVVTTGQQATTAGGSVHLVGGGDFAVTAVGKHFETVNLAGGGTFGLVPRPGKRGPFLLRGAGTFTVFGVQNAGAPTARFGSFKLTGGGIFTLVRIPESVPQVRLVWDHSIRDVVRPDHPLWRRFDFPATQTALALFRDGRVVEVTTLYADIAEQADYIVAGGHEFIADIDAWQVKVLTDAGYTLVLVEGG